MRNIFLGVTAIVLACVMSVGQAEAASKKKPLVDIVLPVKKTELSRKGVMPVELALTGVTRPMALEITTKLIKKDKTFPVGFISGGSYLFPVVEGQTSHAFDINWGLNDTIPGKYSITARLRECNEQSCTYSPPGKVLSKKSKSIPFTLVNNDPWASSISDSATTVTVLKPNGGESYVAGSGKSLKIAWEAEGVPKGSTVQTLLISKDTGGIFVFPGENKKKKAKDGKDSVTGKLIQNAGYDLAPGEYWVKVNILPAPSGSGKDDPVLAEDISDDTFTLE